MIRLTRNWGHYHMWYPLLKQLEVLIAVYRLLEEGKPPLAHNVLMCAKHGRNTWWDIWNYTTLTWNYNNEKLNANTLHKFITHCPASNTQQWNNIWNYYKLFKTQCPIYYWYINTKQANVLWVSNLCCWTVKSPVILRCVADIILIVQLYIQIHLRQR